MKSDESKGNLYAATAEAKPGLGGGKEAGAEERGGRPETKDQGVAIPSQPPKAPAPPPVPQPNPGEPPPIPKRPAASPAEPRVEGLLHSADVLPVGLFFAAPQPSPDDDRSCFRPNSDAPRNYFLFISGPVPIIPPIGQGSTSGRAPKSAGRRQEARMDPAPPPEKLVRKRANRAAVTYC